MGSDVNKGKVNNGKGNKGNMANEYEKKLNDAATNIILPDEPDVQAVQEYVMKVNEKMIRDEI